MQLEAGSRMVVLFRIAERKVDSIRVFSEDCELDAGGRPVNWLDGVRPGGQRDAARDIRGSRSPTAATTDRWRAPSPRSRYTASPERTRARPPGGGDSARSGASQGDVLAWQHTWRTRHGHVQRVLKDDPSIEVRKSAVFGVSQSRESGAFDALANLARNDPEPRMQERSDLLDRAEERQTFVGNHPRGAREGRRARGPEEGGVRLESIEGRRRSVRARQRGEDELRRRRAERSNLLARPEGRRQGREAITDRIDNDPNTEVKKKAVFSLSQLPPSEGVPLLINVARTNANREVRKQAMFWLGQSRDPRALAFFEEVLTGK